MSPKKWFKTIVNLKKLKADKSKQAKVQSTAEKSNESSAEKQDTNEDSSNIANAGLMIESTVPTRLIEDIAATRIQNVFRSFLARGTFHHLSGTVKFEALNLDHMAKEQTVTALNYIHLRSRIQDQIRARRLCMITEARIKQKKLENQLKLDAKIHELEVWCGGSETIEEILSRIHHREEAAVKRERAMAYAFSHQWRPNCSQYLGQASYRLGKENWGWSWKERWVAARPWEIRVRVVQGPITKKINGQQHRTKVDKNDTKLPLSKPDLSNGKEIEKGKENTTP